MPLLLFAAKVPLSFVLLPPVKYEYIYRNPEGFYVGKDENLERCIVITAYEPDENIWEAGFKSKKH